MREPGPSGRPSVRLPREAKEPSAMREPGRAVRRPPPDGIESATCAQLFYAVSAFFLYARKKVAQLLQHWQHQHRYRWWGGGPKHGFSVRDFTNVLQNIRETTQRKIVLGPPPHL